MFHRQQPSGGRRCAGRVRRCHSVVGSGVGIGTLIVLALTLAGCATPDRADAEEAPRVAAARAPSPRAGAMARRQIGGRSVEGREIPYEIHGDGPDVCLILATIHGNEAAGTPLVRRLARHVESHPSLLSGRRLILVPIANPDGYVHDQRGNRRGIDLNRNFPAPNFTGSSRHGAAPLSEPESRALHAIITEHRPHRVVSIHQPVDVVDYDGDAEGLARAMARESGMKVKRIGSRPGSLGSWVGLDLGIPIITLELPRDADRLDEDALWQRYGRMLIAAVVFPDAVAAPAVGRIVGAVSAGDAVMTRSRAAGPAQAIPLRCSYASDRRGGW